MPDVPAKEALSSLQLDKIGPSPRIDLLKGEGLLAQAGAAAEKGSAFKAALRPDLPVRSDAPQRSDATARPNVSPSLGASTSIGRGGEGLDIGKVDLPVLRLGSSDQAVGLAQRALVLLGAPTLRADGVFGKETDQAVRAFQEGNGLARDGLVGNRQTWPAINQALVTRHEGVTRLTDAVGPTRSVAEPQVAELKQLSALLAEVGEHAVPTVMTQQPAVSAERPSSGELTYAVRGGETLADVARMFSLPIGALIAANPELAKPYLILQGQLLTVPNPVKERTFRRPPRQLHPADPEGYLADANMNPGFVALVNGMIIQLRGEGYDVRVIAGVRSFAEQQQRFEQGRRSPGRIVTDAEAGHSWHNYGLAVDIVLNDDDGRPAWPEDSAIFWQRLGDVALAHGVVWGGLVGYPAHVEYHPQFERDEAGSLIEDFESHGLEPIWERIALELPPKV